MSETQENIFAELIERTLGDFRPVRRLWPVGIQLTLWVLLCAGIVAIGAAVAGGSDLLHQFQQPAHLFAISPVLLATVAAGYLALRSAIPDRAASIAELSALALAMAGALLAVHFAPPLEHLGKIPNSGGSVLLIMVGLAVGPVVALFWGVRRGFSVHPQSSAVLIGVAGFGFSLISVTLLSPWSALPISLLLADAILTPALSVTCGAGWLSQVRTDEDSINLASNESNWLEWRTIVPLAVAASIAITFLIPQPSRQNLAQISDFDLAITSYRRSLAGFHPNVPSGSIDAVVAAFVEHGMPPYMWDFGPSGFPLIGGRFDRLADGTPLTYTLFRGDRGGVMCMVKRTDRFAPPAIPHEEKNHLLFYRYKGFSVCLINVGGYGNFISVIVAPMPMKEFTPLVLKAVF